MAQGDIAELCLKRAHLAGGHKGWEAGKSLLDAREMVQVGVGGLLQSAARAPRRRGPWGGDGRGDGGGPGGLVEDGDGGGGAGERETRAEGGAGAGGEGQGRGEGWGHCGGGGWGGDWGCRRRDEVGEGGEGGVCTRAEEFWDEGVMYRAWDGRGGTG